MLAKLNQKNSDRELEREIKNKGFRRNSSENQHENFIAVVRK